MIILALFNLGIWFSKISAVLQIATGCIKHFVFVAILKAPPLKGSSSSSTDTSGSGSNPDTDSGTTDPVSTEPSTPDPGQTNDPNNP